MKMHTLTELALKQKIRTNKQEQVI